MWTTTLFVAQLLWIAPSGPPASPAEAVAVLRSSHSDRNVTGLLLNAPPQLPQVLVIRSTSRPAPKPTRLTPYPSTTPWVHVGQAFEPTINVRIIGEGMHPPISGGWSRTGPFPSTTAAASLSGTDSDLSPPGTQSRSGASHSRSLISGNDWNPSGAPAAPATGLPADHTLGRSPSRRSEARR